MNEEFSHKDFEKQLKDSADNFMPGPSDKVWTGIRRQLHPRRDVYVWRWAAGVLLLLAIGICLWQYSDPGPVKQPPRTMVNGPVSSGNTPRSMMTPQAGNEKTQPVQQQDAAPEAREKNPAGPAAFRGLNSRAAGIAAREASRIPHPAGRRRQLHEPAGLPVLPRLQPDLSAAFRTGAIKYTPSFSGSPVRNNRTFTLLQQDKQDSLGFAKKTMPAGLRHPSKKKPVLELSFTPGIGYRTLKMTSPPAMMADPAGRTQQLAFALPSYRRSHDVGVRQHPDYGWTAAAGIMLPLGKQWFFRPGISLTKTGYSILAYDTYPATIRNNGLAAYADRGNNSFYTVSPAGAAALKLSYVHSRYLAAGVPLLFGRQFGNPDKVSFTIGAGVGIFYLITSDPLIYSPDSKRYFTDKKYLHPFNGNLHLETSIHIPLSRKFQISLGPALQYQIFSSYKHYPQVKEHPYLLGIKTGLQLK